LAAGDRRKLVLVSFGGFGSGALRPTMAQELDSFVFMGFSAKPQGLKAEWIPLGQRLGRPHVELLNACDIVIGKPGYGTFAEAFVCRKPMLYLPRQDFPEVPALVGWLERHGRAHAISREDFFAGRWRDALERALADRKPWSDLPVDGDCFIAGKLLRELGQRLC
ncbi:MAG: hypothetical protein HY549_12885, partial [Elusimicrobia bacterium]|nr:hypothetical protein [Elusimicrobiota bacterium]